MTEEELAKKKKYAGEKKPSMKSRASGHDYTERRFYMITIETEDRLPLFGHLAGNPFVEAGSSDAPHIVLSELGKAVQDEWFSIPAFYPQIDVIALQMMPDHLHGILFVKAPLPTHLGQVITGFKAGCRKAQRRLAAQHSGALPPSPQEAVSPLPTPAAPTVAARAPVPVKLTQSLFLRSLTWAPSCVSTITPLTMETVKQSIANATANSQISSEFI